MKPLKQSEPHVFSSLNSNHKLSLGYFVKRCADDTQEGLKTMEQRKQAAEYDATGGGGTQSHQ